MIQINKIEREIEFRLGPNGRLVLRAFVILLTNTVLALMVLGTTRVFELTIDYLYGKEPRILGTALLRYLTEGMYVLDLLIINIFFISALVKIFRLWVREIEQSAKSRFRKELLGWSAGFSIAAR